MISTQLVSRFAAPSVMTGLGATLAPATTAPTLSADVVHLQGDPAAESRPQKTVSQALVSAAKWGAVGGVLSAIPFVGYFVSAAGGAIAGDLIAGKKKFQGTAMLLGATAGLATHVIPIAGIAVGGFAILPATVLFGAAAWGLAAYHHARGDA